MAPANTWTLVITRSVGRRFLFPEDVTKHIGSRCDPSVGKGNVHPDFRFIKLLI